jgi:flagellar hook protein FlgE
MSIYGAMFSGVSGIAAQSQAMGMIADNISNVNTVGYKTNRAAFSTLVTQSGIAAKYSPGGVNSIPRALVDHQGLIQASASATDLAISGDGFFVVNTVSNPTTNSGQFMYTRAGSYTTDAEGNLRNAAGHYLQAWSIDSNGNLPTDRTTLTALETVNVKKLTGSATATTAVSIDANLKSSQASAAYTFGDVSAGTSTAHFARTLQIFDSKGGTHGLTFSFFRDNALAANQWRVEIHASPASDVTNANGLLNTAGTSVIAFNTDGTLDLASSTIPTTLNVTTWAASLGIANSSLAIDWGTNGSSDGITQFDSASTLLASDVNGAVFGSLTGVTVTDDGVVTALFDNGTRQDIYKLPIALFPNPNGLGAQSGNAYIATTVSGDLTMQEAGTGGAGLVAPSSLEASTVDLAEEFTTMIQTQRAYSAASRIITTSDEMLDELIRLVR